MRCPCRGAPTRLPVVLVVTLAAVLGACVARPPPEPPLDGPAAWRRSIEVALGEWRKFGGQVVHYRYDPAGVPTVVIDPVRRWEDDRGAYESVLSYWASVGEDPGSFDSWQSCFSGWQRKCPWHLPWSAAFVSYVMQEAGVPRRDFPRVAEHWAYVRFLIAHARSPGALFRPERVDAYRPEPGDLICKTRGGASPPDVDRLIADPDAFSGGLPMHCDIVVANRGGPLAPDGVIEAIGGNVMNSVSKSLIPSRGGYLVPGLAGRWFIILRNAYGAAPVA
jgi:hypothetical protein